MKFSACMPLFRKYATNSLDEDEFDSNYFQIGKMVKISINPQFKEASGYGDDALAEYIKEFNYAEISNDVTTIPMDASVAMFGIKKVTPQTPSTDPATYKDENGQESNYGCFGFIYGEVVDGVKTYYVYYLPRVKFDLPGDEYETKGENIVLNNHTIAGRAFMDNVTSCWREKTPYPTLTAAITALKAKVGGTLATAGNGGGEVIDPPPEENGGDGSPEET